MASVAAGGQQPVPGKIGVCFYCAEVLEFDPELKMQVASKETLEGLPVTKLLALSRVRGMVVDTLRHQLWAAQAK